MYLYNTKKQNICSKKNIDKHSSGWYSNFTKEKNVCLLKERENKKKRFSLKKAKKGVLCFSTISFIFILVLCYFLFHSNTVNAKENSDCVKYYTSVYIEPGDTLTSIAKKYQTAEYSDLSEYIEEIKYVNDLHSDHITAGCYIVVPYYAEAKK